MKWIILYYSSFWPWILVKIKLENLWPKFWGKWPWKPFKWCKKWLDTLDSDSRLVYRILYRLHIHFHSISSISISFLFRENQTCEDRLRPLPRSVSTGRCATISDSEAIRGFCVRRVQSKHPGWDHQQSGHGVYRNCGHADAWGAQGANEGDWWWENRAWRVLRCWEIFWIN